MNPEVNLDEDLRDIKIRSRLSNALKDIDLRLNNDDPDALRKIKTRRDLRFFLQNNNAEKYRGVGKMALRDLYAIAGLAPPNRLTREVLCPRCSNLFVVRK